jgi:excisionase family DNA binding protein
MLKANERGERNMTDLPAMAAAADGAPLKPLAVTVPVALHITGLGRTKLYQLLDDGTIKSVFIGRRRLINFASLERLIGQSA